MKYPTKIILSNFSSGYSNFTPNPDYDQWQLDFNTNQTRIDFLNSDINSGKKQLSDIDAMPHNDPAAVQTQIGWIKSLNYAIKADNEELTTLVGPNNILAGKIKDEAQSRKNDLELQAAEVKKALAEANLNPTQLAALKAQQAQLDADKLKHDADLSAATAQAQAASSQAASQAASKSSNTKTIILVASGLAFLGIIAMIAIKLKGKKSAA